ncbi:hypothetical protein YC2023_034029 [Brassica napus]
MEANQGSLIMARGRKEGYLYVTQAKLCKEEVNVASDDIDIWHRRLGHMSEKGLNILSRKKLLPDMKGISLSPCHDFLAGKQHRVAFRRSSTPMRRKHILDLVHTDVCSMSEKSNGGASYFVTFVDDHSRKVWVYLLKSKDQVLDAFKEFVAQAERSTGQKLKYVRSDNGGEYRGPFEAFCKAHGIRMEKTPPKTPQLNGLAERMSRTITERVRCMLSHAKLPKPFWGEAIKTAVDVINLTPSVPLEGDVPEEVWSGKKVSYNHLKVFGCRAFVHIPRDERAKLDSKTKECIYLGSPRDDFGYRLWDPVNRKIIRSRDVVFFEDQTIEDINKSKKPKLRVVKNEDSHKPQDHEQVIGDDSEGDPIMDPNGDEGEEEVQLEPEEEHEPRRSGRERRQSVRYYRDEYVNITDEGEPQSYKEAIGDTHRDEWVEAMQDEMQSLHDNHTYELMKLPKGKRALKNKWVYRLKHEERSSNSRYKARLVVKGFNQKKVIDFEEIFSQVVKMSSIRVVLGLAAVLDLEIEQLDVKMAFLHGELEEEIYMEQPEGFKVPGKEELVCRLRKSLYGLKQAPRQWYKKFDSFMVDRNFKKTKNDHCVFIKRYESGDFLILLLYVDDMLIVGQDRNKIAALKKDLGRCFVMKDLGQARQILGMNITRNKPKKLLWLSQERYVERVLERFNMHKAKPVSTPLGGHFKLSSKQSPTSEKEKEEMKTTPYASAVGSLMYAMVCPRSDIAYAVGVVSRFLANPGKEHWKAVKWILRYLRGTTKKCLCFGNGKLELVIPMQIGLVIKIQGNRYQDS